MKNYQDIVKKLNKLLGLQKFSSYKLKDSESELILEGDLAVDEPVYVITDNGQLPAQDGEYVLEDTTKIKIEDGIIQEIKYDMEKQEEKFVEATLKDGTVVKSPTFDVGEDISIVSPDGNETPAPDGEHELSLKDSEGNEVLIKVITKDGKIVERENVELGSDKKTDEEMGMTPDLSEGNDIIDADFKKSVMGMLEEIKEAIKEVIEEHEEMKSKVAKFSKQPAGEPVKQAKNAVSAEFNANRNDAFSKLLKTRHNL
jgi:major membrane immunogen (membrane-anchored lipoprotein)